MKKALFLFDTTGYAAAPFTEAGWETWIVDILNTEERAINKYASHTLDWNILEQEKELSAIAKDCLFIFGFPPCTDLAVSGAMHFNLKKLDNPNFQDEAVHLARSVERIGDNANTAWALENPVGRLSTLWRPYDFSFDPCDYGGYLSEDDEHPEYPEYVKPRDAYVKKTCIWHSFDFLQPPKDPVLPDNIYYSSQHKKLGGKSVKTKMIRSATPRGFFKALFEVYNL